MDGGIDIRAGTQPERSADHRQHPRGAGKCVEGATPYLRDLPKAELHMLDTGHFALEEDGEQIARLMRDVLGRQVRR